MASSGRHSADSVLAGLLAGGQTLRTAASLAGLSERTAARRTADPRFRAEVERLRADMLGAAMGRMSDGLTDAADTLRALLKAKGETARLGAARTLIELTLRMRESVSLEDRLAEVERRIGA